MSQPDQVDARGMRVVAGFTAVVLALALVTSREVAVALLAVQAAIFAIAAFVSLSASPWALAYRRLVRPHLSGPPELEDARPPAFAQKVGLVFTVLALVGFLAGVPALGYVATAFALVAALLNAVVGLCLGCEMYLVLRRAGVVRAA